MHHRLLALAGAASLALLTACSSPGDATVADAPTADTPGSSAAASTSAAASSAAASAAPSVAAWSAPAACTSLELAPGAVLPGAGLGDCVAQALSSYGSGVMSLNSGNDYGTVSFRYAPDYAFHGSLTMAGQAVEMTYLDAQMWIDSGAGAIKGDADSADPEEVSVAAVAQMYRVFSDPAQAADLVAASPTWTVEPDLALRTLDNGEQVQAHRLVATEPFSWNEIPVGDMILWFAPDWTPVGTQATLSVAGIGTTTTQQFYDLGEPVEIVAPN